MYYLTGTSLIPKNWKDLKTKVARHEVFFKEELGKNIRSTIKDDNARYLTSQFTEPSGNNLKKLETTGAKEDRQYKK